MAHNTFHLNHPAARGDHGFPVGNGRLGAMQLGATAHERIQISEETVWAGRTMRSIRAVWNTCRNCARCLSTAIASKPNDSPKT